MGDGRAVWIAGHEPVKGDIVLPAEGDRNPTDLQLLGASNMIVDESMLMGESMLMMKHAESGAGLPGGDAGLAHAGTLVTQGTGRNLVTVTGVRSTLRRIGMSLGHLGNKARCNCGMPGRGHPGRSD